MGHCDHGNEKGKCSQCMIEVLREEVRTANARADAAWERVMDMGAALRKADMALEFYATEQHCVDDLMVDTEVTHTEPGLTVFSGGKMARDARAEIRKMMGKDDAHKVWSN